MPVERDNVPLEDPFVADNILKTTGIRWYLERTPGLNYFYFTYFDEAPSEEDVSAVLGTFGVVAALFIAMVSATFGIVPFEDYEKGRFRFEVGGEYGCIRYGNNESLIHHHHWPSIELPIVQVEGLYLVSVVLYVAIMILINMSSLSTNLVPFVNSEASSAKGGTFCNQGAEPILAKVAGKQGKDLTAWWSYMRWFSVGLFVMFLWATIWTFNILLVIIHVTGENRGLEEACKTLGWYPTGERHPVLGGPIYACSNEDYTTCFRTASAPFFHQITDLTGGYTETGRFHALCFVGFVMGVGATMVAGGYGALAHQSQERKRFHQDVLAAKERYLAIEGPLHSANLTLGELAQIPVQSPAAYEILKDAGVAVRLRGKIIALAHTPGIKDLLLARGSESDTANEAQFGFT